MDTEQSTYQKNKASILKSREKNKDKFLEYQREYQKKRYNENSTIIEKKMERLNKKLSKLEIEANKIGYTLVKIFNNDI